MIEDEGTEDADQAPEEGDEEELSLADLEAMIEGGRTTEFRLPEAPPPPPARSAGACSAPA